MELRQLQQFSVLAETLNFHRAADRLHIAQPPLSVSIRKLEEEWRVRLFDRDRPGVRLTEAGHAALADARRALFHAAESERMARATVLGTGGRLRIGFVGTAKYRLLPRLLPAFQAEHPGVTLTLSERSNGEILHALENGELDAGIIRVPLATRNAVRSSLVEKDSFVAALPVNHPLANKRRLTLADLADEPFVHYAANEVPGLHALTMLVFQAAGIVPKVSQEAVQVQTVICLVESGMGVALVPSVAAETASKRVVFRKLHKMPPGISIGLAVACASSQETSTARRFFAVAEALADGVAA